MQVNSVYNKFNQAKNLQNASFGENASKETPESGHQIKDEILHSDPFSKLGFKVRQAAKVPSYAVRGMQGDPDANFFEFLKITKIPYFIGGPMLAVMFMAGKNGLNVTAKNSANMAAKKVALGVAMYYLATMAAKAVIDIPVKMFRGIDLNHPYKDVVDLREGTPLRYPENKKTEYHKVYESADFTRWDLLYDYKKPTDKEVNSKYDDLCKKFGVKAELNDSDSTLKEKIRSTIKMAGGWKYMLTAPFVMMGLGLATQDSFQKVNLKEVFRGIKKVFNTQSKNKLGTLGINLKHNIAKPFFSSLKELWQGKTPVSKALGRFSILTSVFLPVLANMMILSKSSGKEIDFLDLRAFSDKGVKK